MAILDQLLLFEDGAALTASRVGSNTLDFGTGAAGQPGSGIRDVGATDQAPTLGIRFTTLPTAAGAATIQFSIMTSSDNVTFILLQQSGAVAYTQFTASAPWGPWRKIPIPAGVRRFVRLDWTVASGPLTAGNVLAGLSSEVEFGNASSFPRAYVS